MVTRRQYAVKLGLAKQGRGKLSKSAHEAINKAITEGMEFDDTNTGLANTRNISGVDDRIPGGKTNKVECKSTVIKEIPINHDYDTVWGIDEGRTKIVIAFQSCAICSRAIKYCSHEIPQLPKWLGGGDALVEKPCL